MKKDEFFPSRFLKGTDDIFKGGREVTVVIDRIEREEFDEGTKAVIYFQGKERGVVLNAGNWDRLEYISGSDDTDNWPGREIVLYTELATYKGKTAPAIRVKAPLKKQNGPQLENKGRYDTLKQTPPQEDNGEQEIPF